MLVFVGFCELADFFDVQVGDDDVFGGFFHVEGVALLVGDVKFDFVVWASGESVNHGGFSCPVGNDEYANFLHEIATLWLENISVTLNLFCPLVARRQRSSAS